MLANGHRQRTAVLVRTAPAQTPVAIGLASFHDLQPGDGAPAIVDGARSEHVVYAYGIYQPQQAIIVRAPADAVITAPPDVILAPAPPARGRQAVLIRPQASKGTHSARVVLGSATSDLRTVVIAPGLSAP
jgi:hypothetical protein